MGKREENKQVTEEEARQVLVESRKTRLDDFSRRLSGQLRDEGIVLVPRMVIVGGKIVQHDVVPQFKD